MVKISDLTIDPEIQLRARGTDANTVSGYVEAIANGAEFPPVIVFSDNGVLLLSDGFHRVEACRFLGLAEIETDIRPGTRKDARVHAAIANVENGRPMSRAQKEEAGKRLLKLTNWSQHRIAKELAITQQAVSIWEHDLSNKNLLDRNARTVTRGDTMYTMDVSNIGRSPQRPPDAEPEPKMIIRDRIEKGNGIVECVRCHNLYDGSAIDFCPYCAYTLEERIAFLNKGQAKAPHVSHSAGNNEWYTPREIIEAAHVIMGEIELDPASTAEANTVIRAQRYYTPEDDGLAQDWRGKTWMNPPYAQPLIEQFASKLVHHVQTGDIPEAIVLVNNATETMWFIGLINIASAVCFSQGRIKFWSPDGRIAAPLQGQAIIYIGDNTDKFLREFKRFGWTARIVSPRN